MRPRARAASDHAVAVRIDLVLYRGAPQQHYCRPPGGICEAAVAVERRAQERSDVSLMLVGVRRVRAQVRARERLCEPCSVMSRTRSEHALVAAVLQVTAGR
jgi:hypothetical protein